MNQKLPTEVRVILYLLLTDHKQVSCLTETRELCNRCKQMILRLTGYCVYCNNTDSCLACVRKEVQS